MPKCQATHARLICTCRSCSRHRQPQFDRQLALVRSDAAFGQTAACCRPDYDRRQSKINSPTPPTVVLASEIAAISNCNLAGNRPGSDRTRSSTGPQQVSVRIVIGNCRNHGTNGRHSRHHLIRSDVAFGQTTVGFRSETIAITAPVAAISVDSDQNSVGISSTPTS